ncbi:GPP34 family phosphoprotein [Streptosporangiaceae bacterium NEAU-GS5]|nr:GPP34 family phosphoprotein [Streptosporangiaceae bacterium NEAU-GS5]
MSLLIAEELVLLAYRPDTGRLGIGSVELEAAVAGGVLAELVLGGRIALDGGRIVVTDPTPPGDEELDAALARLAAHPKARKPEWWVGRLKSRKLRGRLLDRLIARGILTGQRVRILGIFPTWRFPALDLAAGQAVRDRVASALAGAEPDARTTALLGLVQATRLHRKAYPGIDKARLAQLTQGDWISVAVRRAINAAHAAAAGAG